MNKWTEIFVGLILVVAAILVWGYSYSWGSFWNFKHAAWEFLKGGVFWVVALVGILFILLGISDLKE